MSSGHQQVSGNINSFNVNSNNIVNFVTEIDAEILQWLSPLEPQQRHKGVRIDRLDGVGNWILETTEFRKWSGKEDGCAEPVLFCYGNPGVGKTYLSSLMIDSLCDRAEGKDIAVVGLYCDFLTQQEQSTASMLGAVLKQLVSRGGVPEHIRQAFQKAKKEFGGRDLRVPDLVGLLRRTIAPLERVFICIDALDESAPKHRRELLESLREIVQVSPNTRIFLTGRPHIDDEIMGCFSEAVRIAVSPTQGDIKSYLEMRLDRDTDPSAMDDELRADIMRVIPAKISEIFLLVSLNMDAILGEITLSRRRKKLGEMIKGEGLGDAYSVTLSRVKAQPRRRAELGMQVLMWVSHSERPLHVDELCHALGVEEGSIDLDIRNVPAIETLLACSLGLVMVEKSSSTVRLIHYTLQEYLSHNPGLFLKPHSMIGEVCLTYLNFRHVRGFSPTLHSIPPTIPFAKYASCYWGTHARRETSESVKRLALELLDGYDGHISSKMLLLHGMDNWDRPLDKEDRPRGFSGLHSASYFGCEEITIALLEMNKWDVRATDFNGNTAFAWAARRGHLEVVKILLERDDVDPDIADTEYGQTPLSWAAGNGHTGVVRMLLEQKDVDPNITDTLYGRTPLLWAAENGHEAVVRMLLERNDVDPSIADIEYGRTPLSWAAENGDEAIVRILLERSDVDPSIADAECDRTPLSWAAGNGHEAVVKMLLERNDVNPGIPNTKYGRTPVSWAAENGHEGVVSILLGRNDVDPNITDTLYGRTPLLLAAENGHEAVVRMLLERNDVDPSIADTKYGRTPLSWAAENGDEAIVKILLERSDVDPNTADIKYGRTPLSWAAENGHHGAVRILLERGDTNPNKPDAQYGRTPLSWAAESGHKKVVEKLLERNGINPNTADAQYGRTPLLWAAQRGHEEVVEVLLNRNDVDPNTADTKYDRTSLWWATRNGHQAIARMLLGLSDINPNKADTRYGRTPLSWAAGNGHEVIVRILLERSDINPNTSDTLYGRTPLQWAARSGHQVIATLLREPVGLVPRSAVSLLSTKRFFPEPSEPPSKRARRF